MLARRVPLSEPGKVAMKRYSIAVAISIFLLLASSSSLYAHQDKLPEQPKAQESERAPTVKPGSKDDIDAIGSRDIGGGKGLGNWYSIESEIRCTDAVASQGSSGGTLNRHTRLSDRFDIPVRLL